MRCSHTDNVDVVAAELDDRIQPAKSLSTLTITPPLIINTY